MTRDRPRRGGVRRPGRCPAGWRRPTPTRPCRPTGASPRATARSSAPSRMPSAGPPTWSPASPRRPCHLLCAARLGVEPAAVARRGRPARHGHPGSGRRGHRLAARAHRGRTPARPASTAPAHRRPTWVAPDLSALHASRSASASGGGALADLTAAVAAVHAAADTGAGGREGGAPRRRKPRTRLRGPPPGSVGQHGWPSGLPQRRRTCMAKRTHPGVRRARVRARGADPQPRQGGCARDRRHRRSPTGHASRWRSRRASWPTSSSRPRRPTASSSCASCARRSTPPRQPARPRPGRLGRAVRATVAALASQVDDLARVAGGRADVPPPRPRRARR